MALLLAGPVSAADGAFELFRWRFKRRAHVFRPDLLKSYWDGGEHPEGICRLESSGNAGLLILYDTPDERRIKSSRYRADWIAAAELGL
jgi:hypothetical protein